MNTIKNTLHTMFSVMPPIVLGACALMVGIACQMIRNMWYMVIMCVALGELLHRIHHYPRAVAWLVIMLIACCGALRFSSQQAQQLTTTHTIPYGLCTIKGTILTISPSKNMYYPHHIKLLTHHIVSLHNEKKVLEAPIVVQISLQKDMPLHARGEVIELTQVALFKETLQDKQQYLVKNNLHCTGKTTKESIITLIQTSAIDLAQYMHTIRQRIITAARECFSSQTFILVSEMFFGYPAFHETNHEKIRELFGWWGLNHFLARSGLHLVMFVLLFGLMLSNIPLPFLAKHILILATVFIYIVLSWPSISFIRAVAMMVWYTLCIGIQSAPHPLHIIACVTIGVLLYQPWYIMGLDFQLSFALTFALAMISHATKIGN